MKTAAEFQKRFWSGFENSDLGNDLEKHLTNLVDNCGLIKLQYGTDSHADEYNQYYINVNDTAYTYAKKYDRNFDVAFFNKVMSEYLTANNLPKSKKSLWVS